MIVKINRNLYIILLNRNKYKIYYLLNNYFQFNNIKIRDFLIKLVLFILLIISIH